MANRLLNKTHLYLAGSILSLALLSIGATNIFLAAQNKKLRLTAESAGNELVCNSIRTELIECAENTQFFCKAESTASIQFICRKYHLDLMTILDENGRTLFNQCNIPLTEEIARQLSTSEVLRQLADAAKYQITQVLPIHNAEIVFSQTTIPSIRCRPKRIILFAYKLAEMDWTDSFEVWIAIMQVILVCCTLAIAWYGIRRMTRPYEAILKEIYKNNPPNSVHKPEDELTFLVGSFKSIIQQLREKETQLNSMHLKARKRAEHSEQYARDILACLHQAVICFDYKGMYLDANPTLEELLSLKRVALQNRSYHSIFDENPSLVRILDEFYAQPGTIVQNNITLANLEHNTSTITVSISMLTDPQGAFYGAILVMDDETEIIRLRNLSQANESLTALSVMSAGIAHEMKNGLAAISGYAQMISGNARPGAEQKRAQALVREVESMTRVISLFMEYSKPLHPEKSFIPLDGLIDELVIEYSERFPLITWKTNHVPTTIYADSHLLRRAFSNVLLNAAQAIASRGKDIYPNGQVNTFVEVLSGGTVRVRVEDNGVGIDTNVIDSVFTPFFTTKAEGTGMGLPVVKKFLACHNGTITIDSTPDQGTDVEITFPPQPEKGNKASI